MKHWGISDDFGRDVGLRGYRADSPFHRVLLADGPERGKDIFFLSPQVLCQSRPSHPVLRYPINLVRLILSFDILSITDQLSPFVIPSLPCQSSSMVAHPSLPDVAAQKRRDSPIRSTSGPFPRPAESPSPPPIRCQNKRAHFDDETNVDELVLGQPPIIAPCHRRNSEPSSRSQGDRSYGDLQSLLSIDTSSVPAIQHEPSGEALVEIRRD